MISFTKKISQALGLLLIPAVAFVACTEKTENTSGYEQGQIDVTSENYNQAEKARNFNNWVKLGSDNKLLLRTELSPIGPDAPTIRMNLDTLYSVGVFHNDGEMSVTIPESGIYQSIMILDTDGYTPFYFPKP